MAIDLRAPGPSSSRRSRSRSSAAGCARSRPRSGRPTRSTDRMAATAAGRPDVLMPPTFLFSIDLRGRSLSPTSTTSTSTCPRRCTVSSRSPFTTPSMRETWSTWPRRSSTSPPSRRRWTSCTSARRTTAAASWSPRPSRWSSSGAVTSGDRHRRSGHPARAAGPPADRPHHARTVRRRIRGPQPDPHRPRRSRAAGLADVFAHGMLSMAYLGRLLTAGPPRSG